MRLYSINLLSAVGFIAEVSNINKVLTFVLVTTAIILNTKKLFERPPKKKKKKSKK